MDPQDRCFPVQNEAAIKKFCWITNIFDSQSVPCSLYIGRYTSLLEKISVDNLKLYIITYDMIILLPKITLS